MLWLKHMKFILKHTCFNDRFEWSKLCVHIFGRWSSTTDRCMLGKDKGLQVCVMPPPPELGRNNTLRRTSGSHLRFDHTLLLTLPRTHTPTHAHTDMRTQSSQGWDRWLVINRPVTKVAYYTPLLTQHRGQGDTLHMELRAHTHCGTRVETWVFFIR